MVLSFRHKMLLIAATAASAFLLVIAVGLLTGRRVDGHLQEIEARYVPLLELGPLLEADLDAIQIGLKDAVAAQDPEALKATDELRQRMLRRIDQASSSMEPGAAMSLRAAVEAYYRWAFAVSQRLIRGETGEAIVDAMGQMQLAHNQALAELNRAAKVDRAELTRAFDSLRQVTHEADWMRFGIAIVSLGLVLTLSLGISRSVLRSLGEIADGFARFGEGDFSKAMLVLSADELGEVARGGNQMADKLRQVDQRHRVTHWIGSGQAGLALELRGDLPPTQVAERAIGFLARHVEAPAAAFYALGSGNRLELIAHHGLGSVSANDAAAASFAWGEGLVGTAAKNAEIVNISEPPADGLRLRSGLMDAVPRAVVLVPILHQAKVKAVVELLLLKELSADAREFLSSVREPLGAVLEVAYANEDLKEQQRVLETTNVELRNQTEELDSFSYSVSHDLRAPLRAIDGFARILVEDHGAQLDSEGQRVLGVIRSNTHKMGCLIDDLLAFSRLGRQTIKVAPVDMSTIAKSAFGEVAALENERNFDLVLEALPPASGDSALLRQVWTNLLANAVKYTRGRTPTVIKVKGTQQNGELIYSVQDNGVGFDMKYADKLFGVFQRLHGATEFEGTGVGLALVSRIVKRHGGRVWAEGKPGEGATFAFALPKEVGGQHGS